MVRTIAFLMTVYSFSGDTVMRINMKQRLLLDLMNFQIWSDALIGSGSGFARNVTYLLRAALATFRSLFFVAIPP